MTPVDTCFVIFTALLLVVLTITGCCFDQILTRCRKPKCKTLTIEEIKQLAPISHCPTFEEDPRGNYFYWVAHQEDAPNTSQQDTTIAE